MRADAARARARPHDPGPLSWLLTSSERKAACAGRTLWGLGASLLLEFGPFILKAGIIFFPKRMYSNSICTDIREMLIDIKSNSGTATSSLEGESRDGAQLSLMLLKPLAVCLKAPAPCRHHLLANLILNTFF